MYQWSGRNLKTLRERKGFTQVELLEELQQRFPGTGSRGNLSRWETAKGAPNAHSLGCLADVLYCHPGDFFENPTAEEDEAADDAAAEAAVEADRAAAQKEAEEYARAVRDERLRLVRSA